MQPDETEKRAEPREPWKAEDHWLQLAIALGIVTVVLVGFTYTFWIVQAETDAAMLVRVQVTAAFVTLGLAAVTFCTVIWRGLISTRQADLQHRQLDRLTRQIVATEENNLSIMLQKGAEFLIGDKPASLAVGIATLRAVATDPNGKYAEAAMDLLADDLQERGRYTHTDPVVVAAIDALRAGAALNRRSSRRLRFAAQPNQYGGSAWHLVEGLAACQYAGGRMDLISEISAPGNGFYSFSDLDLRANRFSIDFAAAPALGCTIHDGRVVRMQGEFVQDNRFARCCFSGTVFTGGWKFDRLSEGGNWYDPDDPPILINAGTLEPMRMDWTKLLRVGDPHADLH